MHPDPKASGSATRGILSIAALVLLLACACWAYQPGLNGGFLFDDAYNLNAIGRFGPVRHLDSLLLYLTSGTADPLGRPLSLLSFLVDATDWPADPLPFKRTNLVLHLINGALLAWTLLRLGRASGIPEPRARGAALLGGGLWLLHPLWVSTTLYVVQREAMLPATCTLIAFLIWIEGRSRFLAQSRFAIPLMLAAAWPMTLVAALCKANGALLPLLLLVAEFTLFADRLPTDPQQLRRFKQWRNGLLGLPSLLLLAAVLIRLAQFSTTPYDWRGWNDYQHLISEARVLVDYLHALLVPRASISGLFNDQYPVSTDLLHPATTLPAVLAVLALVCCAFGLRRKLPLLSFALLFYFGAQLIESSLWPLELYFEHRNYLAAMPLFWPFAVLLLTPPVSRSLGFAIGVVLLTACALLTRSRAGIWGDPHEQARLMMADARLDSPRATITAANDAITSGQAPIAAHWLRRAIARHSDNLPLTLTLIDADCTAGDLPADDLAFAVRAIATDRIYLSASALWFARAMDYADGGNCRGFDWDTLNHLFETAQGNPGFATQPDYQRAWWHARGEAALRRSHTSEAVEDFNNALLQRRDFDMLLSQLSLLGGSGHAAQGLAHLQYFHTLTADTPVRPGMPRLHHWLLEHLHYWDGGLQQIAAQLQVDANAGAQPSTTPP